MYMNKLKFLLVSTIFALFATASFAQISVGVTGTGAQMDATGKETQQTSETRNETLEAIYGPVFVEYDFGGFSLGFDLMPYSLESERAENERGAGDAGLAAGGQTDTGNNTVQVNIENFVTLYGLVPIGDTGGYVKAGISQADLITDEAMGATSTAYPDTELDGYQVTAGWAFDTGVGASIRAEVG